VQRIYQFLKSTIIGGLVILVPLGILAFIAVQVVEIAYQVIIPIMEWLPIKSVTGTSIALLLSILVLIAICFLAGLLAETTIIQGLVRRVERLILSAIPGYALMKEVGENLVGFEDKAGRKSVLVRFESSFQLGFLIETLPDGRQVVFVPSVPNAFTGALHIFSPDRVQVLPMSATHILDALGRLGIGLRETWPKETISAKSAP
jgi:uncharacterized membrane protein